MSEVKIPWYEGVLPVIDFETTGVRPEYDLGLQVALILELGGKALPGSYYRIINPGEEGLELLSEGATAVHGITKERVLAEGQPAKQVFEELATMLNHLAHEGSPLVVYNAPFDITLLYAEFKRWGIDLPKLPMIIDSLQLDYHYDKYRAGSRKLIATAEHYGFTLENAHDALADCIAAAEVVRGIVRRKPHMKGYTLEQLFTMQKQWYDLWAKSRNEYWAGQGDERRITLPWPGIIE